MALPSYTVLYAFEAEEEGELTVQKGDIVSVDAGADGVFGTEDDTRDGWALVQNKRNMQTGYVPVDYLQIIEAPAVEAPPPAAPSASASSSAAPGAAAAVSSSGSPRDDRAPSTATAKHHGAENAKISFTTSTANPATPSLTAAVASENFEELLAQNEAHFSTLTQTRTAVFRELEGAAGELEGRIARDGEKGAELVQKLDTISTIIEQQRRALKRQVDEDKAALAAGLTGAVA